MSQNQVYTGAFRAWAVAAVAWAAYWIWHVHDDCWWIGANFVSCHHHDDATRWFDHPDYPLMVAWLIVPPFVLAALVAALIWILSGFFSRSEP
jgi:hypothetical protein